MRTHAINRQAWADVSRVEMGKSLWYNLLTGPLSHIHWFNFDRVFIFKPPEIELVVQGVAFSVAVWFSQIHISQPFLMKCLRFVCAWRLKWRSHPSIYFFSLTQYSPRLACYLIFYLLRPSSRFELCTLSHTEYFGLDVTVRAKRINQLVISPELISSQWDISEAEGSVKGAPETLGFRLCAHGDPSNYCCTMSVWATEVSWPKPYCWHGYKCSFYSSLWQ